MPEKPASERPPGEIDPESQAVFDTVVGPNLRPRDNLFQLIVIVVGTILGAIGGAIFNRSNGNDAGTGAVVGGFFGLVVSLLLSGTILGVYRFFTAVRRR